MSLQQTLAPKERGIALYKDGAFQGYENVTTITDEQLADEAEAEALAKADELIDAITTMAAAKVFLKRLCKRLIRKGFLP